MCVDDGQTEGGTFERVQIFILAQELKKLSFTLSGRESSLVQTCVCFDFTYSAVHMTWRFVIQGCPTLNTDSILQVA